ncbi:MAG: amino acid ABC transporter substrate-binding protein [Bauldia sp.]|nr:amino acid ABC transporter substrate-binding protein [Bauldia sp.]
MQAPSRHLRAAFLAALALGVVATQGIGTASASTLDDVRGRDKLICGISEGLAGFSDKDQAGNWYGFDVDFCRAVAAAVLGDPAKVDYVQLSATDRFKALTDGKIDLLSRNSTWTMSRDLDLGIDFAGVAYYDGQGFLAHAVDGMSSALELNGARICVVTGTTTEDNAAEYFANNGMEVTFLRFADRGEARKAYAAGDCDVYTADSSALAAERSLLEVPDDHVLLREVISKEPLGPVTRESDPQWTELVRWVLYGLINAEEAELTAASVDEKTGDPAKRQKAMQFGAPGVKEFGLADDWLIVVLDAVGNYGDIFERNLGEDTPLALRRGVNALWTQGGILYAPPMH